MLGREWAYKNVKNRIICEEYLDSSEPYGLNDYKVFCFDSIPKMIQVTMIDLQNIKGIYILHNGNLLMKK